MRELLQGLANQIWKVIVEDRGALGSRYNSGESPGGDAQFPLDYMTENVVWEYLESAGESVAVYTEGEGLRVLGSTPEFLLSVDPIDGTRGASADLEMACVSIAAAPYSDSPTIGDVEFAILKEIKSGNTIYADASMDEPLYASGYRAGLPQLTETTDLDRMFWSMEFNGHPAKLMTAAYGHLIDASANPGAVYVFNSASFSISRIITGQMDAYVDIGNRLLRDHPDLETQFRLAGHGNILHLFPYDIAASVFLAKRAGVVITDAYGNSLDQTVLTDVSVTNQRSCIAASTPELHSALLEGILWNRDEGPQDAIGWQ